MKDEDIQKNVDRDTQSEQVEQTKAEVRDVDADSDIESVPNDKKSNKCGRLCKIKRFCKYTALLVLIVLSAIGGAWSYARISPWLEDHNFNVVKFDEIDLPGFHRSNNENSDDDKNSQVTSDTGSVEALLKDLPVVCPDRVPVVVQAAAPGVVTIAIDQATYQPGVGLVENGMNIGTGFIVDPSGVIVTNQHVVSSLNADYKVILDDDTEYQVSEIVRDDTNDIAIVKIDAQNLHALELGDSDKLVVGQGVIAMGNPLGQFAGSVTTGVVSGLKRSVSAGTHSLFGGSSLLYEGVIQTDASINPGNSGGPLLDYDGKVIGVNFATTAGADNISFALPINRVKKRIDEYRKLGRFTKPVLGVQVHPISAAEARIYKDVVEGAYVLKVYDNTPAKEAGLQPKDIIHKVDGEVLDRPLSLVIQSHEVGDTVKLEVWRPNENLPESERTEAGGKFIELEVTLMDGSVID